jgi:beta-propeller repeat-containing protein
MKFVVVFALLGAPAVCGATRYSFHGSDRAGGTSSVEAEPAAAGSGFTTYIGDGLDYQVARVVSDAAGNTYITGNRLISSISQPFFRREITDVFVTKLDAAGNLVFTATIGGKGADRAGGLALDTAGNIYLAGSTSSQNFPLRNPLQSQPSLGQAGFLVKLSSDGSRLIYSSYFGGTLGATTVNALAVDSAGNMYVTGNTYASDFPHTAGLPAGRPGLNTVPQFGDAFITKISADGSQVVYSAILTGGSVACGSGSSCFLSGRITSGVDIGLDATGNAYIAGNTNTTDLPTTMGALRTQGIGAFVAKVNAAGTAVAYLTYLGSENYVISPVGIAGNTATALAVDAAGSVYVTGATADPNFPATAGSFQPVFSGPANPDLFPPPPTDAFVAKLSPDGAKIVWATFLGGSADDAARSVALDPSGNVWLGGTTASPEFPNKAGWSAGRDFLIELNATGSALLYSSRFPDGSASQAAAVDSVGSVHFAGTSGIVSTLAANQTLSARVFGVANAAGGSASGRIAPGGVDLDLRAAYRSRHCRDVHCRWFGFCSKIAGWDSGVFRWNASAVVVCLRQSDQRRRAVRPFWKERQPRSDLVGQRVTFRLSGGRCSGCSRDLREFGCSGRFEPGRRRQFTRQSSEGRICGLHIRHGHRRDFGRRRPSRNGCA